MLRGSDLLLLALPFVLRGKSSGNAAPGLSARGPSLEVPRVRTGGDQLGTWFGDRFALALENLAGKVPDHLLRAAALSLVSQWAHETGRGKAEFNFNLGGWTARKSDPFFSARDVQTPGKPVFKWTAYNDLPSAVADQVKRLVERFPTAFKLLAEQPHTSAWIEELGRRGYFTANPSNYARAWASNRAELERLAP
jgi:hypothetical protein